MANYKVIQDIEAEDKLVGPLTLKQFIYAGIAAICLYICFLGVTKHFPYILLIFLPLALTSGFFAFPWGRDQPTETWALAKIRFLFKPRRRIWDQSDVKKLVTITAPKKINNDFTNGLSQTEVKSRLRTLADTIDSRGWAVKNVNVNLSSQTMPLPDIASDRLIDPASLPQLVPIVDVSAADDIMDENSNPVAQHFEQMIEASARTHRQNIVQQTQQSSQPNQVTTPQNNYWFLNQPPNNSGQVVPGNATFQLPQVVAPGTAEDDYLKKPAKATAAEELLAKQIEAKATLPDISYSHMRTIQPFSAAPMPASPSVTQVPDPVIIGLANNNDRSVESIAREINQTRHKQLHNDEVIITLH